MLGQCWDMKNMHSPVSCYNMKTTLKNPGKIKRHQKAKACSNGYIVHVPGCMQASANVFQNHHYRPSLTQSLSKRSQNMSEYISLHYPSLTIERQGLAQSSIFSVISSRIFRTWKWITRESREDWCPTVHAKSTTGSVNTLVPTNEHNMLHRSGSCKSWATGLELHSTSDSNLIPLSSAVEGTRIGCGSIPCAASGHPLNEQTIVSVGTFKAFVGGLILTHSYMNLKNNNLRNRLLCWISSNGGKNQLIDPACHRRLSHKPYHSVS